MQPGVATSLSRSMLVYSYSRVTVRCRLQTVSLKVWPDLDFALTFLSGPDLRLGHIFSENNLQKTDGRGSLPFIRT